MKNLLFVLPLLFICSFCAASAEPVNWTITLILTILVGCYEVISRLIPTSTSWSIIGKALEVLTWLSKLFDRKK